MFGPGSSDEKRVAFTHAELAFISTAVKQFEITEDPEEPYRFVKPAVRKKIYKAFADARKARKRAREIWQD